MPVVKKRRSHHGKSSRTHNQIQQQLQQQLQAKQRFENSRLRPEHVSSVAHDESDTISFRSYLLRNYIKSAEYIDVLTTQLIPLDKIRPPEIFKGISANHLEEKLSQQRDSLSQLQQNLDSFKWELNENSVFLKDKLSLAESNLQDPDEILNQYETKFNLKTQENGIVIHKDKYTQLQKDQSRAPDGYWSNYAKLKDEYKENKLKLQREQEQERQRQEEERRVQEEEELRRRQMEQYHLEQEQQQREREHHEQELLQQQQQQQVQHNHHQDQEPELQEQNHDPNDQGDPIDSQQGEPSPEDDPRAQVFPPQQQNPNPNMMDGIFGDFGNEPFNNGFDDEFGDIDTAFF